MNNPQVNAVVSDLRDLTSIRRQCGKLYKLAEQGKLNHFQLREENLDDVAQYILEIIKVDYPKLEIPYHSRWRHFEAGGVQRHLQLQQQWSDCDALECARRHIDLVVMSVLIDAGAGAAWTYHEVQSARSFSRSEGLGIASFWMFSNGLFSSQNAKKHQVDAVALKRLTMEDLETGFQVTPSNPLVGLSGRLELLRRLGHELQRKSEFFAKNGEESRPGHLVDFLISSSLGKSIDVRLLWKVVLEGLQDIWPTEGRCHWNGMSLGDVWHHSALGTVEDPLAYIPFHKLSQWLTYSLLEPLTTAGLDVSGCEALTGLPEYRNGGLFIDFDVLVPQDPNSLKCKHAVGSEWVVEWRALTVVLLDRLAQKLQNEIGLSPNEFPLAKVLEAGTWKAGRKIAAQRRPGAQPPVDVVSDGTVF